MVNKIELNLAQLSISISLSLLLLLLFLKCNDYIHLNVRNSHAIEMQLANFSQSLNHIICVHAFQM